MSAEGSLVEAAAAAVALAKKAGAQGAAASATRSRRVELGFRDGRAEKVEEATTRNVSLSLFVDGRWGHMSTSDLRPAALRAFTEDAITMVRALAPDPLRALPEPSLYPKGPSGELGLYDPSGSGLTMDARVLRAKEMEDAARAADRPNKILSVGASVTDRHDAWALVTSNGFSGETRSTTFQASCEVSVKDADGRRPDDWEGATTRRLDALPKPAELGRRATARALSCLGATKGKSGVMPMVVDARASGRLLAGILVALTGRSLSQRQSFLEGQLGKKLGSDALTLDDDPLLVGGLGTRPFDSEGLASQRRKVLEAGVLRSYFLDCYYARKTKQAPTTSWISNLVLRPGQSSLDALLARAKRGVYVTSFLGGNTNTTTGEFSAGIRGFFIENGKRGAPLSEMNVAGDQNDFWKHLVAVANEPYVYANIRAPAMLFDAASIAGV